MNDKAGEAHLYWCAVSQARRGRETPDTNHTNEAIDDLEVLLIHSEWPLVKQRVGAFLTESEEKRVATVSG